LAFANFLVWRLRTGVCGVGANGFWRYRMPLNMLHMPCSAWRQRLKLRRGKIQALKFTVYLLLPSSIKAHAPLAANDVGMIKVTI